MTAHSINPTNVRRPLAKATLLTLVLFASWSLAVAQSTSATAGRANMGGGSASGALGVTATVVTSVGVIIGPDGEPKLVVANGVDAADNFSRLTPVGDNTALHVNISGKCAVYPERNSTAAGSCGELTIEPRTSITSTLPATSR